MPEPSFEERILRIFRRDSRFNPDAYHFVSEALQFTQIQIDGRTVTGADLADGIRLYALQTFGPAARRTLRDWGVLKCEDLGELVFNMVDAGLMAANENDRREDFHGAYDFQVAFPEPVLPRSFFQVLLHLFLDDGELDDVERRFDQVDQLDLPWLAQARLNPFISNAPPTEGQMSLFHELLEGVRDAAVDARFDDAVGMFEQFGRSAYQWESKPDMMMHDLLVELEPYCPDFAGTILAKIHLTPDAKSEFSENHEVNEILSGRDSNMPRGFHSEGEEVDIEKPERDLAAWTGFGHAPPVSHVMHVYMNRVFVDLFEVSRASTEGEIKAAVLKRSLIIAALKNKNLRGVKVIQKHYNLNVCVEAGDSSQTNSYQPSS